MKAHLRKQVVILGGGFAGLSAALQLANEPGFRRDYNVTLVDKNCYHLYHGLLYEVATAHFEIRPQDIQYLQGGVCIRLKALGELVTKRQIDFMQATVTGIDRQRQRVLCGHEPDFGYDHLVIALGSEPTDYGIAGLREHSVSLRDIPDALAIRDKVRLLIAKSNQSPGTTRQIIVAGGGFTGVEFAGELLEYIRRLVRQRVIAPNAIGVTIVEASDALLKSLGADVSRAAQQRLARLGARFELGAPIARIGNQAVQLPDGRAIPFDLLVWSGGIQANRLLKSFDIPTVGRGQVAVEPTLRVKGSENLWAAGDCVMFIDPATGKPIPQVAPLASDAGRQVAKNVARSINGLPLLPWQPRHFGFVVPVGGKFAIARTRLLHGQGLIAWILRRLIDLNYFMSIMSFRKALRVFIRGARVYLKND
ncbi:MAG: NAD(P)/FAD-dependent oxidoreductase [Candidatus Kerfeldbacteria bacterium]|nr:NAD(P)/FAD-dependent oxidoreductase [Candidatus Kerfeldbacteria bacterium]